LAQRLPQAEHVMLPGLGHLAHEEAPREVAQRVTDWVLRAREGTAR
jgi:pimeloyl-ACP methyl ester carboxylesterase